MVTKTNLTIILDGKKVNVYTPSEIKNLTLKNRFTTQLNRIIHTLKN